MDQQYLEMDVKSYTDSLTLESGLKQLWEKVRSAAERISQLKDQNDQYRSQVEHLEKEIIRLRNELGQREEQLKRLKFDHSQLSNSMGGDNVLTPEEKEVLKSRIKDLIARINSHL